MAGRIVRARGSPLSTRLARGLACFALIAACGVPPVEAPGDAPPIDFSTLPNLRRAREALEDRIVREREYAAALMQQLEAWQAEEDRIFKDYLQAEHDFQLIEGDLAGTREELERAQAELATLQADLARRRTEVAAVRAELTALLEELERLHGLREEIEAFAARLAAEAAAEDAEGAHDGEGTAGAGG